MSGALRVLHLEPDAHEARRVRERLQEEGLDCAVEWVRTREAFVAALQQQGFDLVLADYALGGLDMLRHVRELRQDLPVVTLAAALAEDEAVDCMNAGATDYVIKQRLRRLGFSVRHAVAEQHRRAALRQAQEELRALNTELEARVRQRTTELETTNAFLDSIVQHIPYQVIVKNASDLSIVRVNRYVEELTGRSQAELVGKTVHDFVRSREEADFFTLKDREALALGREVDIPEEPLHSRDGKLRTLHAKKLPIFDESGQVRYLLTMSEDITERKKRQHEIERLNAALAQRTEEVEAANRAKGTFLATMSHEIRTPMHGMLGMLELLSLSTLDAGQRETLEIVRHSSRSLLRIIDDILDFSKIEAGKLDIHPEAVSIRQLVEEVQGIYLGSASTKGLVVRRMVDPRVSPALRVDPVRLRQILNNFVSNAIKFTAQGWIDINVQWLGRAEGQERLRFEVKDTGLGISHADQQRLFHPFSQAAGEEGRRRAGGTGLGLVISRQLAALMGGTIALASEPGLGTSVALELALPIVEGATGNGSTGAHALPQALAARRAAPGIAQAEAEGTLVLLADDHPVNRMLLQRQVATLGYAAQTADDGEQALALWKSGRFGLLITDCHMPHMDGYALARSIRGLEAASGRPRVPIIACTANALPGESEACFAAGMDDFLVKPVELSVLVDKMDHWLPLPAQQPAPVQAAALQTEPSRKDGPVDEALLTTACGGDTAMVDQVLAAFRRSCDDDAAGLQQAVAAADATQASRFAHRMAGASRMVGALALAAACEPIDRAGRAGDWQALRAALPDFERERARLLAWLAARRPAA